MTQSEIEIRDLLLRLNHWEQNYGTTDQKDAKRKDRGEVNARIAELKKTLEQKGAIFSWNGMEYVLNMTAGPES